MNLQNQLIARLQGFDDQALIALANRGLFRRASKDLEQQDASVLEDELRLRFRFVGQQIEFTNDDPRSGRCDCKASGICHHVLGVLLWLKRQAMPPAEDETAHASISPPMAATINADLLLDIDEIAMQAYAGAAALRWAREQVLDLDLEREFEFSHARYPVLRLPRLQFELRCVGARLTDFIAPEHAQAKRYTLLALLAYRRSRGMEIPTSLEDAVEPKDVAARMCLLDAVGRYACELIELGLIHVSPALSERTELLATWAQAQGCYRLAARLRRCGEQIDASVARLAHSDSAALLDELAFAYALTQGLQQALSRGLWPPALVGQARRTYAETETLHLWGLAAWPFHSASGFKGLSMLFYAPVEREFFTLTDARPAGLGFDPFTRFTQGGPWRGMPSPRAALGQVLLAQNPRRAGQRLSTHEATLAQLYRALSTDNSAALPAVQNWRKLPQLSAQSMWLTGNEDFALLKPTSWLATLFDEHRQVLHWTVLDENALELTLTMPYSALHAGAVAAIERFVSTTPPGNTIIIVRLQDGNVQPLGWLHANAGGLTVGAPFFEPSELSAHAPPTFQQPIVVEHPELSVWRRFLLQHAERGIGASWPAALAAQCRRAEAQGMLKFAALAHAAQPTEALLRSWVFLQQLSTDYARNLSQPTNL